MLSKRRAPFEHCHSSESFMIELGLLLQQMPGDREASMRSKMQCILRKLSQWRELLDKAQTATAADTQKTEKQMCWVEKKAGFERCRSSEGVVIELGLPLQQASKSQESRAS